MVSSYLSACNAQAGRLAGRYLLPDKVKRRKEDTMSHLIKRFKEDLHLSGYAIRSIESYVSSLFKDAMKKAQLIDKIDPSVWKKQWVVDSQAVGKGQDSLRYLSRYVFRVAISNNRIKSFENGVVKFQYKDRQKKTWKTMALDAMEFIRRFLQHVLPKGFIHPVKFPIGNPI